MNITKIMLTLIRSEVFGDLISADEIEEIRTVLDEEGFERLYKLSTAHDVAHLVGAALREYGLVDQSSANAQKLYKTKFAAAFRCERIIKELDSLMEALETSEIDHIALKGSVIRALYPQAWMRTSCDVDILVREQDFDKAVMTICHKLGYRSEDQKAYHDISLYSPDGTHLELHFSIKENMDKIDKVLSRSWDFAQLCEGKKYEYRFTNEYLYFHILAHASYHFVHGGCGVRSFVDMMLIRQKLELDRGILDNLISEVELSLFESACTDLCRVWFENASTTDLISDMEDFIISGGVYGTVSNSVTVSRGKKGNRIKYLLSRIFVPYKQLKISYPILEKRKYLTPIYQIVRWTKIFSRNKNASIKNEIKINNSITDEQIDKIKKMMVQLGLD